MMTDSDQGTTKKSSDEGRDAPQTRQAATIGRRRLLKAIAGASGGMLTTPILPAKWIPPGVETGVLPAHAQVSAPPFIPIGNQFAVMGTVSDGNQIVIFPTANKNLPNPAQHIVPGLPSFAGPHGVAFFGTGGGLVSSFSQSRIFVVDLPSSSLTATISTAATYNGSGTIAVSPDSAYALASGDSRLLVMKAPFNASTSLNALALPGIVAIYQTQAIVFSKSGRAFVYHTDGIAVLDPPYSAITFNIPIAFDNSMGGSIAISPDGNTLLCTDWVTGNLFIFKAPFSPASTSETLVVSPVVPIKTAAVSSTNPAGPFENDELHIASKAVGLVGIVVTPDNSKALVCSSTSSIPKVFAISAPFSSASAVEEIPLPASLTAGQGFEDIGLSPDGQLIIVTGGSAAGGKAAFIQAPFTAAGATVHAVDIAGGGRGAGAVRFHPPPP